MKGLGDETFFVARIEFETTAVDGELLSAVTPALARSQRFPAQFQRRQLEVASWKVDARGTFG
jgi:hypothetical protein